MFITLDKLGKKYGNTWVFRNLDYQFEEQQSYAIVGNNGSGKSTLLKIISSYISPNEGNVSYTNFTKENAFKYFSICAPYIDLKPEFTFRETLTFIQKFNPLTKTIDNIIKNFDYQEDKLIKDYSSGMYQRVKLSIALYSSTPILLLDEPTSNLDDEGKNWYYKEVKKLSNKKTIIIASNIKEEYESCKHLINLKKYN